jgi:lipid-binding SYLF domain-containing protein
MNKSRISVVVVALLAFAAMLPLACRTPAGETKAEQRKSVRQMRDTTLADLYKERPDAKGAASQAVGYAVFSSIGTNLGLLSTGRGYGLLHENGSGKETYMKMMSLGGGVGLGVKDYRIIFFFFDKGAMEQFRDIGVDFAGQADAAAQTAEEDGIDMNATQSLDGAVARVAVFQMTEAGLAAQATLQGTKYSVDEELN